MARLTYEQLERLKKVYNVNTLWSWSRVDKAMTSKYEYFLKYVKHVKENNNDSAYAPLGGVAHSILEDFYNGNIKYGEMLDRFEEGWEVAIDFAKLKFNRTDKERDEKIKNKYRDNLKMFFLNHSIIPYNVMCENFLVTKIGENIFQGYVDAIYKDDDDNFTIIDFKTSTIYTGKTLKEHSGQLTIYAMALIQNNIPIDKIKICFNFLKYATVEYTQANGKVKSRNVERGQLGEKLSKNAQMWLRKEGYSDAEIDEYSMKMIDSNSICVLPVEIQSKFDIKDCYVYVDLDEKLIEYWTKIICDTITDINCRLEDYYKFLKSGIENDRMWWDSDEVIASQEYYFSNLCGYTASLLKPYKEYLEKREAKKNGLMMFNGVGENIDDTSYTISQSNVSTTTNDDIDLSWLNELK